MSMSESKLCALKTKTPMRFRSVSLELTLVLLQAGDIKRCSACHASCPAVARTPPLDVSSRMSRVAASSRTAPLLMPAIYSTCHDAAYSYPRSYPMILQHRPILHAISGTTRNKRQDTPILPLAVCLNTSSLCASTAAPPSAPRGVEA